MLKSGGGWLRQIVTKGPIIAANIITTAGIIMMGFLYHGLLFSSAIFYPDYGPGWERS